MIEEKINRNMIFTQRMVGVQNKLPDEVVEAGSNVLEKCMQERFRETWGGWGNLIGMDKLVRRACFHAIWFCVCGRWKIKDPSVEGGSKTKIQEYADEFS